MASLEVNFEVECHTCKRSLTTTTSSDYRGNQFVYVEPCEYCLDAAKEAGREEAREEADTDGDE